MENSPENCNVKVALHIRPLLRHERQNGGQECLDVVPGSPQVLMGAHSFIFDHVYGGGGSPSENMYEECAAPLLDALFQGYNGTVIAYGQTGSGKTYTMGTNPKESSNRGLIIQVMNTIFSKIETLKHLTEFQLHVSFIEILKEEVRDLLESAVIEKRESLDGNPESTVSGKQALQIRKAADGAVNLGGSSEVSVSSQKEMIACLEQGCLNRSVASTDMNSQSSRSHAIFTIILEQKDKGESDSSELMGEEFRCAKLHLVDLAGSERAKRAGSEGVRLKEGIQINKGLLALGNVISALGDDKKRKEGLHIPYRDSKLTRLLQASLGGNCKTVMIACASPADYNAEETLNTLKYANRARNIQNKASVQKEVFPADTHKLRQQLRLLQAELAHRKEAELVELQDLKRKIDSLEATNSEVLQKFNESRKKQAVAEATNSELLKKISESRKKYAVVEATNSELLQKIHVYRTKCAVENTNDTDAQEDTRDSQCTTAPEAVIESVTIGEIAGNILKEPDKMTIEQEHEIQNSTLPNELNDLDKRLEQKEKSEMKFLGSPDVEALKQRFGETIIALEEEKRFLQIERDELRDEIERLGSPSGRSAKEHTMSSEDSEANEILELERKHEHEIDVLKQKHHDALKRLQDEVRIIKSQKVQLQQKVKHEEENFRQWKTNHEKQMLQVKKESRKSEFELNKLQTLYQRQTQVLQRKAEEALRATKKLKELLEARKVAAKRETTAQPKGQNRSGQSKTLKRWLSQEIDKVMNAYKLRMNHEKQTQNHAKLKDELSQLKQQEKASSRESKIQAEENKRSRARSPSPNKRATRIVSLESKLKSSSAALSALSTQISESGKVDPASAGRWKTIHALGDAKDLLQYLFNIAIDARRRLMEKEYETKDTKSQLDEFKSPLIDTRDAASTQTTSIQNVKSSLTKKWKEIEERVVQRTRDKTPSRRSKESDGESRLKGKAPTAVDIFADMGIESPVPFPESRELDSKAGICNRPLQVSFKQTKTMIPIENMSMKKLALCEQKGKISRWRRSHDEWLLQFKWRWQKPWKLSHLIRTSDQIRNSDETLKGQDLSHRLGSTS